MMTSRIEATLVWQLVVRRLTAAFFLVALVACSSTPTRIPAEHLSSAAVPVSEQTTLGQIALASKPPPGMSGFRLMPLGTFSLDTRVQLARRAQATLDVQYYHFENDETGRWLLRALRDAAVRGVRVRLLLDDLYTGGNDPLWLSFAAHPNVQVRLFNPFCCSREKGQLSRFLAAPGQWSRLNHRMHNKLMIADGAMAVIGGRNVANEYYLRGVTGNFIDVDAFTIGFILPPLQALFDRYWNADVVYSLQSIARTDMDGPALLAHFESVTGPATTPEPAPLPPNDILGYGPIGEDLDGGKLGLIWGDAYVFADHPDKPFDGTPGGELMDTSVTYNVIEAMMKAQKELVASSPYFVPGEKGMALVRRMRDRGVKMIFMTNSLGSTDEPIVHAGYSRYREEMLDLGVDLYELSSSRVKKNRRNYLFGSSLGRLHAKLVVIDRRVSFVGSMNLDPRSATINTELGAVIDSPELARELLRIIDIDRLQSTYRVRKAANGQGLEWLGADNDQEIVLTQEPDTTAWLRLKVQLLRPFVPEEEL